VSELEQRGAAEGKIIVTLTGRRYLLGKAATHASLAAERDDAQREADALREQLEALQAARKKKARALGSRGTSAREGARPQATAGMRTNEQTEVTGSTRTGSSSTTRADNGSELRSARLCWRAALSSGRLTVCSKKKNSDGNHGKPFSN
jgi:hypothetical protein